MENQDQSVPMDVEDTTNTQPTTAPLVQAGMFARPNVMARLPSTGSISRGLTDMHRWKHTQDGSPGITLTLEIRMVLLGIRMVMLLWKTHQPQSL